MFTASDFHTFWTFNRPEDEPILQPPPEPQEPVHRGPHVVRTKGRLLQSDDMTRREPSGWKLRSSASSFHPPLAPEHATSSSAAVNTPLPAPEPLPVPEPLPPAPTSDDDDEFDLPVDPELFSCPPLPSVDSAPQDTQSEEMGNEFILVEEAMRAAPTSMPAPATARGRGRPRGRPRGSRERRGSPRW